MNITEQLLMNHSEPYTQYTPYSNHAHEFYLCRASPPAECHCSATTPTPHHLLKAIALQVRRTRANCKTPSRSKTVEPGRTARRHRAPGTSRTSNLQDAIALRKRRHLCSAPNHCVRGHRHLPRRPPFVYTRTSQFPCRFTDCGYN